LSAEGIEKKSFPSSVRKLDESSGESNSSSSKEDFNGPEGFSFVDISVLASASRRSQTQGSFARYQQSCAMN